MDEPLGFRDLCDDAHDLIQSVRPDGRFLYVNRTWLETLGYSAEDVTRLTFRDIVHPDSLAHCESVFADVMAGKQVDRVRADFVTREGDRLPVEGSISCRWRDGKPLATSSIFRDLREHDQIRERLDRLFELSLDLLCVAGTDGYFKHVNPAFERVLGYTAEELTSRAFVEFVHPEDREETLVQVQGLQEGKPVVDFRNRYRAKDGSWHWLAWRSAPVADQGLIYAVARDITEQMKIERTLARQREELALSNAELEQFASIASHDLRAPLRAIANLVSWIEQDLPADISPQAREHLEKLNARVDKMGAIVEGLLAHARLGRDDGEREMIDTSQLIHEVVELLAPPADTKVVIAGELPQLHTSRLPLEQVFRNLIDNAIKHHHGEAARIEISARQMDEAWEFSVTDDGPGILPDQHDRVFAMFERGDGQGAADGIGLGLALVKKTVEGRGGRIDVDSEPGAGATFRFTWPEPSGDSK